MHAISDALAKLSNDHIAFRRTLNVLERQVNAIAEGKSPNFDILKGVLAYLSVYPRHFHHPIESLIYSALKMRAPEVTVAVAGIEEEHAKIAADLDAFAAAVDAVMADAEVSRINFCRICRDLITRERSHIRREERNFFSLALSILGPEDWLHIDQDARRLLAPLREVELAEHFEKLRNDIVSWDFEDNPPMAFYQAQTN
jgi:hemerythrin-like domain-containing protein